MESDNSNPQEPRLEEVAVPGTRGHTDHTPDRYKLTISDLHILYCL